MAAIHRLRVVVGAGVLASTAVVAAQQGPTRALTTADYARAEKFMNYILEPKVGAALTNYVSYGSPNKAAEPFIDKAILDNPLIYPPADALAKLPFQKDIGEDELKYSDRWTEVKSA